jgi:hypothetical protein
MPFYTQLTNQTGQSSAGITIDPRVSADVNRTYTYDPTPENPNSGDERVFANVFGNVQQLDKGKLYDIGYRDAFDVAAGSKDSAGLTSANVAAKGNVIGNQYFFNPDSSDTLYSDLANELLLRQQAGKDVSNYADLISEKQSRNTNNEQLIRELMSKNLTADEKSLANQLIADLEASRGAEKTGAKNQLVGINSNIDAALSNYYKVLNSGNSFNNEADYYKALTQSKNALNSLVSDANKYIGVLGQENNVGFKDIKDQFLAQNEGRQYADDYDLAGNVLLNNRSISDYAPLLEKLAKERSIDSRYGYDTASAYTLFDQLKADATRKNISDRDYVIGNYRKGDGVAPIIQNHLTNVTSNYSLNNPSRAYDSARLNPTLAQYANFANNPYYGDRKSVV